MRPGRYGAGEVGAAAMNATFGVSDFKEGLPLSVVRLVASSATK